MGEGRSVSRMAVKRPEPSPEGGHFAVNILREEQRDLSIRFAQVGGDKWSASTTSAPLIKGCLASFECRRRALDDGGDHLIFLGKVLPLRAMDGGGRSCISAERYRASWGS